MLDDYTDRYADYFPDAYVKFKQLDYQNVSSPLEVRFMGDDIARLKQAGDSLMAVLREMDGLVWYTPIMRRPYPTYGFDWTQWKPPASGSRRRWPRPIWRSVTTASRLAPSGKAITLCRSS